jgi:hypothetical protein
LEPVGQQVTETSSATGKSAVSRRFVAMTETALAELLAADLSGLALVESSTENDLGHRPVGGPTGARASMSPRAMLVGLDGSKAVLLALST